MNKDKIQAFMTHLKDETYFKSKTTNYNNPYINENQYNNLKLYLERMLILKPTVLLVGEAPGYNGCKLSGIPFTSEYIIYDNKFPIGISQDFKISNKKQKERTSTIFWREINELTDKNSEYQLPLLWNIFPYHPYEDGNPDKSNRAPLKDEIDYGFVVLKKLLDVFESIETIYAIGHKAEAKIISDHEIIDLLNKRRNKIGKKSHTDKIYLNHPSNKGHKDFAKNIKKVFLEN